MIKFEHLCIICAGVTFSLASFVCYLFSGMNFSEWHVHVNFYSSLMDLDLALLKDEPILL